MNPMKLTFVGSGVSCGVPVIGHIEMQHSTSQTEEKKKSAPCCCEDAFRNPHSKNKRNNVSLLIELPIPKERLRAPDENEVSRDLRRGSINHDSENYNHNHGSVCEDDPILILIDCGKTFRDAYQRVLAPKRISYIDVLLLTHGHADAMHCTQELCEMQAEASDQLPLSYYSGCPKTFDRLRCLRTLPTFLTLPTLKEVEAIAPMLAYCSTICENIKDRTYGTTDLAEEDEEGKYFVELAHQKKKVEHAHSPSERPLTVLGVYVVPEAVPVRLHPFMEVLQHYFTPSLGELHVGGGSNSSNTSVAAAMQSYVGEAAFPFPVYTLPVEHGRNYISLGFVFGSGTVLSDRSNATSVTDAAATAGSCVVYLSDISAIPPASLRFLRQLQTVDILVIDLLAEKGSRSPPHYCWDDVMPVVRLLAPTKVYCVGMFCSLEYTAANALWVTDLQEQKARVREALAQTDVPLPPLDLSGSPAAEEWTEEEKRSRAERFVACTESIELAYDGLEIEVPM